MKNILGFAQLLENSFEGAYIVDKNRKILFWNEQAELMSGYKKEEVIGQYCQDNILLHTDDCGNQLCIHGCPLQKTINENSMVCASVYLKHKNGYRVPISVRTVPIEIDGNIFGALEFFQVQHEKIEKMYNLDQLRFLALTDHLTGLPNRYYIENFLTSKMNEYPAFSVGFGVFLIDVDNFKQLNDDYGHDAGDAVLKNLSETFLNNLRSADRIGRWGGDEFLGVCLASNRDALWQTAEKLRILAENTQTKIKDIAIQTSITIGATIYKPGDTLKRLLNRADEQLYKSKRAGRNCVSIDGKDT